MIRNEIKRHTLKCVSLVMTLLLTATLFSGCSDRKVTVGSYRSIENNVYEDQIIASNSDYELCWSADAKAILFKSVKTGKVWSDMCYSAFLEGNMNTNANSAISITIVDTETTKWDTVYSYQLSDDGGSLVCKKIDDGIRVTYFFDIYKIAVPIEYKLRDDSVEVSVNASGILENGERYKLISVSIAPFMCSTENSSNNSYLFVPSGSGALMYTEKRPEGTRTYSGEVYGADKSRRIPEKNANETPVYMPIFGAKGNEMAMLGIIENGAGASEIKAYAGNDKTGYSNVGVTFYLRGYDEFYFQSMQTGNTILEKVADNITVQELAVGFYPLYGEDADYNGMAKKYREYLVAKKILIQSETERQPYSLTIVGGTKIPASMFGIPYTKLVSMTTFSQAQKMINAFIDKTGETPSVRLYGYGDNGITAGTLNGGKKFPSIFGKKNDIKNLSAYCKNNNVDLFMDMDIVNFSKSGNGVNTSSGVALNAIKSKATQTLFNPLMQEDSSYKYYLISRSKLLSAAENAMKKAEKYGIGGIAFSSLGSSAYSDYREEKYENKAGIEKQISGIFNLTKKSGYSVATGSANAYAAGVSDVLFDTPLENGDYNSLDIQIPFYQMIFNSYKPMYSEAVNLNENPQKTVMLSVISGTGLGYTAEYEFIKDSRDFKMEKLYGTLFENVLSEIGETLDGNFCDCFQSIEGATFEKYEIINENLSASHFSNGVVIYGNHSDKAIDSPVGVLSAWGYKKG